MFVLRTITFVLYRVFLIPQASFLYLIKVPSCDDNKIYFPLRTEEIEIKLRDVVIVTYNTRSLRYYIYPLSVNNTQANS